MVQKTFSIALDIKRPTANREFEVVAGDNGNILEVTLTDDGAAVDLTGCLVCAIFSKSDGNTAQQDNDGHGITTAGNELTISLYTTSVAPGLVECELQVYSGPEHTTLATSAKFNFMCRTGIANDDTIEATDEWPILVGMMQRVESAEEAEALRVAAEGGRVATESGRVSSENARISAESGRTTAESGRVTAENARASAESGRVTAESGRVTAENTRVANENARISAETARATAEGTRVSQESGRVTAESGRVTAENSRVTRDTEYRKLEPYNASASYAPLNKVTYEGSCYQCILAATGIVPTNTTYWALIAAAGEGSGDMLKATYDADNDGVVDDAEKLGGQAPSYYATAAGLSAHTGNTSNPHNVTRAQIGAATDTDVTDLKNQTNVWTTSGTAPNFTIADATVAAYAAGLRRTVKFHAAGTAATLNFNGKGARNLYEYTGKAANVKAGQVVTVWYDGSNFFTVSAGGGMPDSIDSLFAYTGRKRYERRVIDNELYHLFIFETTGALTITGSFTGDIWLCGSGALGLPTGSPGGGGYTTNDYNVALTSGAISIGDNSGYTGGATTYAGRTANGANQKNGGCGAGESFSASEGWLPAGTGQGTTTRPFASADMPPMCGGCGGAYTGSYRGGDGGSDGSNGGAKTSPGTGGIGSPGLYGGGISTFGGGISNAMLSYGGGAAGNQSNAKAGAGCVMIRIKA